MAYMQRVNELVSQKLGQNPNSVRVIETDLTVTVGLGGNYKTINEALTDLSHRYPTFVGGGIKVEVKLLSGFIMKEQVNVIGIDLGWIVITSEDAVVKINLASITKVLIENRKPAWFGGNKAVLPIIGVLFEYDAYAPYNDGITVAFGSTVQLLPGSGVNNGDRGLGAYYSSRAFCYMEGLTYDTTNTTLGVQFKNCGGRAFMASYGSEIDCARAQLQNCTGDYTVYVIWSSKADIYQSNMSYSTNTAVHARDGSRINARETNVSNSARGYHALHNSEINARYAVNQFSGDGAKNCREYGVLASYNSRVEASRLPVDGSGTGVHASNGSMVTFYDLATAKGCTIGVYALSASVIDCMGVDVTGCTSIGILAENAAIVNAATAIANNCTANGFKAIEGSTINAMNSQANTCGEGYTSSQGSTISANGGFAQNCTTGASAFEASKIDCQAVNASGSTMGFKIGRGSFITATNTTGTVSTPINALTANGIIFG